MGPPTTIPSCLEAGFGLPRGGARAAPRAVLGRAPGAGRALGLWAARWAARGGAAAAWGCVPALASRHAEVQEKDNMFGFFGEVGTKQVLFIHHLLYITLISCLRAMTHQFQASWACPSRANGPIRRSASIAFKKNQSPNSQITIVGRRDHLCTSSGPEEPSSELA